MGSSIDRRPFAHRARLAVVSLLASAAVVSGCGSDSDRDHGLDVLVPSSPAKKTGKARDAKPRLTPGEVAWRSGIEEQDLPPGFGPDLSQNGDVVDGQVTLDLCRAQYPSEKLRLARRQAGFLGPGGFPLDFVISETVVYEPGGAAQALQEVRAAAGDCPAGFVPSTVAGLPAMRTELTLLPHADGWRRDAFAIELRLTSSDGFTIAGSAVYQVKEDVLNAVYVSDNHRDLLGPLGALVNRRLNRYAGRVDGANA